MMASMAGAETGSLTIHMILHAVGEERYEIAPFEGGLKLHTTFEYSDRGNKRSKSAELRMANDYTPLADKQFGISGPSPFALQMAMMRYWKAHRQAALPFEIRQEGHESITVDGKAVGLERYTIANLMFGREILWIFTP